MKVVFMGTPDIAAGILEAIINSDNEVVGVVTQEDKPKGRGKGISMPPVKEMAIKYNIPVYQPHSVKTEEAALELSKFEADIFVVAAYGKILPKAILDMPKFGCINVHASLLPKLRGAAPIQWAIIDGEKITGVTIMQMNEGLDTGDMLYKSTVEIYDDDTADSLYDRLTDVGAKLTVEALKCISVGDIHPVKQDDSLATYAKILDKSFGHINYAKDAASIERLVRGLNSWPCTYSYINGKTIKIWESRVSDIDADGTPGTVYSADKGRLLINTEDKCLEILSLQLEGKKRMDTKSFLLGYKLQKGDMFE